MAMAAASVSRSVWVSAFCSNLALVQRSIHT